MIVVQQPEPPASSPTAEGIQADRQHDAGVDRIAALELWFVA